MVLFGRARAVLGSAMAGRRRAVLGAVPVAHPFLYTAPYRLQAAVMTRVSAMSQDLHQDDEHQERQVEAIPTDP